MKQLGTKLADRMVLSQAVKGIWPFRLLIGSSESLGLTGLPGVSSLCEFFIKSLHSVLLRIRRNADTLGSVTNIKTGAESTIFTKARKSYSECIYRTYTILIFTIFNI